MCWGEQHSSSMLLHDVPVLPQVHSSGTSWPRTRNHENWDLSFCQLLLSRMLPQWQGANKQPSTQAWEVWSPSSILNLLLQCKRLLVWARLPAVGPALVLRVHPIPAERKRSVMREQRSNFYNITVSQVSHTYEPCKPLLDFKVLGLKAKRKWA